MPQRLCDRCHCAENDLRTVSHMVSTNYSANESLISYISSEKYCALRVRTYKHIYNIEKWRERERTLQYTQYCPVISCTIVRVKPQSISGTLIRLAVLTVSLSVSSTHRHTSFGCRNCSFIFSQPFHAAGLFYSSFFMRQPHNSLCLCLFVLAISLHLPTFLIIWHDSLYRSSSSQFFLLFL